MKIFFALCFQGWWDGGFAIYSKRRKITYKIVIPKYSLVKALNITYSYTYKNKYYNNNDGDSLNWIERIHVLTI